MEITKGQLMAGLNRPVISEETKKTASDFEKMVSEVLTSISQAHIFHLQTKSYPEHMALQGYYEGAVALFDGLVEAYQGKYGIVSNFTCDGFVQYKNNEATVKYFEKLIKTIEKLRTSVKDSYLQNQIDTIVELAQSTLYKLKFLG